VPSWRVAVESISATPARGPGACPHGPRVGVYRRREADRVSKACWGRPSSWRASRPRGSMQGPRLSAGRRLQTCRRPSARARRRGVRIIPQYGSCLGHCQTQRQADEITRPRERPGDSMNEPAQRETPHVGIFWGVQTSNGETRLLAAGCPLDQAKPYGDCQAAAPCHYSPPSQHPLP
jgi:hypothetical protein